MKYTMFSRTRLLAIITKEFRQLRRDRLTFAMIIGIPLIQLFLFGYAINTNPRHLPTAVVSADHSTFTRTFVQALKNSDYFNIIETSQRAEDAEKFLAKREALFVLNVPPDFSWKLVRNLRPQLLLEADATDPVATYSALAAARVINQMALDVLYKGALSSLQQEPFPIDFVLHAKYNPENLTQYNIVPGLLGVVLTMTMVIVTSMALTRERERGTIENLLSTPVTPTEVMVGKVIPYVFMGYIQFALILLMAHYLFFVPVLGSVFLLFLEALPFIAANLVIGIVFSSFVKNQMQAMQLAFFFFLPSILLSGFMFPFYGMPQWAQYIGEVLPLTHFVRIVRGIMLKGNGFLYTWPDVWPILLFAVVSLMIGVKRFKRTLD